MKSFTQILLDTGKTDKESGHRYGAYYDIWLAQYRDRPVSVLEIGVCYFGGGSVLALAEYFAHPSSVVWALDNNPGWCCEAVFSNPRIRFVNGDAFNPATVSAFDGQKFDIIIDDVHVHMTSDQFKVLDIFGPLLKPGGIYVVEDCTTSDWLARLPELWAAGWRQTMVDMTAGSTVREEKTNTIIRLERS